MLIIYNSSTIKCCLYLDDSFEIHVESIHACSLSEQMHFIYLVANVPRKAADS